MDLYTFDKCSEDYYLPESIPIYFEDGYLVGYTKPDIEVTVHSKKDGWYEIQLGDYTRLAKAEEFDTVAVVKEDVKPKQESVTSAPTTVQPSTANNEAISFETIVQPVEEPVIETPVAASTKYTPEEATAVYRSIMEANGIKWNPDLKNGGSWGTGWIYLEKGQPEWAGNSSVESFKMGDSVGNSWDSYYLEVTDSDANAVYYTKWHP